MDRIAYAEVDFNVVWRKHESFSEFCAYTGLESCRIGYERSFYPGKGLLWRGPGRHRQGVATLQDADPWRSYVMLWKNLTRRGGGRRNWTAQVVMVGRIVRCGKS